MTNRDIPRLVLALLIPWTIACFTVPVCLGQTDGNAPSSISLKIDAIPGVVRAGSPVNVEILTKNISDHQTSFEYKYEAGFPVSWKFDVRDETGHAPPETAFGRELKQGYKSVNGRVEPLTGDSFHYAVGPGMDTFMRVYVSALYDLSQPGRYKISVSYFDAESKHGVKSNTINVTVEEPSKYIRRLESQGASFSITISALRDTMKASSNLTLPLYLTNLTGSEITFDCARYWVQVYDAQGKPLPWVGSSEARRVHETGIGRSCSIPPYGTFEGSTDFFTKYYDLGQPGKYTIQVSRIDDTSKTWVKSNTITLTVTP